LEKYTNLVVGFGFSYNNTLAVDPSNSLVNMHVMMKCKKISLAPEGKRFMRGGASNRMVEINPGIENFPNTTIANCGFAHY